VTVVLGRSAAHRGLLELVRRAASTDVEVLIEGPSGVGKELYARLIHEQSRRGSYPFVPVNCGTLPADLFENELFGHVNGAYTGASAQAGGLVAAAQNGTLFFDEIDALPLGSQVKLLRLIQQHEYRQLGESKLRTVEARFIAASNVDLVAALDEGRFRSDLFFRLCVVPLRVPPLRERREDIPVLVDHFFARYAAEYGLPPVALSPEARDRLLYYDWPGNVRELENCARFLLCTRAGAEVQVADLPLLQVRRESHRPHHAETFQAAKRRVVEAFERAYLQESLLEHNGNIAAAARASGKHRRAFFELMRRHGLTRHG